VDCDHINKLIESYLDAELTLSDRRDFETHVTDCGDCSAQLEAMRALQNNIQNMHYHTAPCTLKQTIKNQLRDYTGEDTSRISWLKWSAMATGFVSVGALSSWLVLAYIMVSPLQTRFTDDIISAHVRSLMVDHVTDVESTDRHTVKPWFNGRVDFSPPVKDLKEQDFRLIGGRLDYINNTAATALVYQRRAHIINLFIYKYSPSQHSHKPQLLQRNGYNVIYWSRNGLNYCSISDLNKKELTEFSQLMATF